MATYVFLGLLAFVIETDCVLVEVYAEAEEIV
jgi:hypothetical protein